MPTPFDRIAEARARLVDAGIPANDAAFDAEVLARHALDWDRATLFTRGREPAPGGFDERFEAAVARRLQREPVALIVGRREFRGHEFEVSPDVLVPRPETELVVDEAVAVARTHACRSVIDVGTGSGCIAIATAAALPDARVLAIDRSDAALEVARRNASRLGVRDRVSFLRANVLAGVDVVADLILSNPPYIPVRDAATLPPEVVKFEPHAALFGGEDGLGIIRRLLVEAIERLAPGGWLVIEFGLGQEPDVRAASEVAGWTIVHVRADLQGIPRTIVLTR